MILVVVTIMLANATGELLVPARLKRNVMELKDRLDVVDSYPVQLACTVGRQHCENKDKRFG